MDRDVEIELLEALLQMVGSNERPMDAEEARFAVSDYTDIERFERERARVFLQDFNVVCLATQISNPGDFLTTDVVGIPVLVVHGEDNEVRAFLNVCRHRGATVELRESGNCKRFVCPYHAWTYATDGSLRRVRHADGFPTLDRRDHGLVELACMVIAGIVFVCPTAGLTPQAPNLALANELEAMLGERPTVYASTSRVWNANWKILVEGGLESYHFAIAHKDTIASFFTDTQSTWQWIGSHLRSVMPKRSIGQLNEMPRDQWRIRDHAHILYLLNPNALILLQKTHFDLIMMKPLAVDRTQIDVLTVGSAPQQAELSDQARTFLQQNHAFSVQTLDEDFVIGEQIQRGLTCGANTHLRFARFEGALTAWRRAVDDQLT